MRYEIPPLPEDIEAYIEPMSSEELRIAFIEYAEQAIDPLLAEIERLKRGEFICKNCSLRKNAETPEANF